MLRAAQLLVGFFLLTACVTAPLPGKRIEEARYLQIGGIDQWVTIRGADDRKPVLILIHGGPGDVQSPFVSTYAPYEKDFVLVQWDQRGAGRSFEKYGAATPDLTLEREIADGIEFADWLHQRFPENRLILLGHSWGTILAAGMIAKRSDLFDAYVGAGQVASWAAIVNTQFDVILAAARRKGDAATIALFEGIGRPDPTNVAQYFGLISRGVRANTPAADAAWLAGIPDLLKAQNVTEATSKAGSSGMSFSGGKLLQALIHADLTRSAPGVPIPYCVIQGSEDLNAPTSTIEPYFAAMNAPKKKMTVIKGAGHFALATHAAEFISALKECPGV
jgi:pimeloyl-ACP methyl ester carboxylesterase